MVSARLRFIVSLAALIVLGAVPLAVRDAGADVFPVDAVGRLIVDDTRVCTAFVVRSIVHRISTRYYGSSVYYENWIATAGHCLGRDLVFVRNGVQYHVTQVIGFSGGPMGYDVMIASFQTDAPVPTLEPAFGELPALGDSLLLIGYSYGALMIRVSPLIAYDDRGYMEIQGYASPGNSGGPVLIPGTRRVVGIGIETTLDRPANASPLHCVLVRCAVKPPYTAAHIDRILGVARF